MAWTVMVTGMGMVMVADLPFVHVFGSGMVGYGALIATWGGGSVLGSLGGRWVRARTEIPVLVASVFTVAVGQELAAISPRLGLAVSLIGVAGLGDGFLNVAEQGIRQRRTPDEVRSRVMAAADVIWQVVFAASFLIGGFAVRWMGPRGVYGFAGMAALVAAVMLLPLLRHVHEEPTLR